MTIHWDKDNPWSDRLVYVTLAELAECCSGGKIRRADDRIVEMTPQWLIKNWKDSCGNKLDAYIIPAPEGEYSSCGVRYGPDGHQYLSPYGEPEKVRKLLKEKGIVT